VTCNWVCTIPPSNEIDMHGEGLMARKSDLAILFSYDLDPGWKDIKLIFNHLKNHKQLYLGVGFSINKETLSKHHARFPMYGLIHIKGRRVEYKVEIKDIVPTRKEYYENPDLKPKEWRVYWRGRNIDRKCELILTSISEFSYDTLGLKDIQGNFVKRAPQNFQYVLLPPYDDEVDKEQTILAEKQQEHFQPEPSIELPQWLDSFVKRVHVLQKDSAHPERDHEDLVAGLFELLGYKRTEDIKFRRGRIDILICDNNDPLITIEVKSDWLLSSHNRDHIKQAFNYAHERGTRYVIVTNGNRYVVYDRERGLSYDESLVAEFDLTSPTADTLEVLESLRKGNHSVMTGQTDDENKKKWYSLKTKRYRKKYIIYAIIIIVSVLALFLLNLLLS